jgi:hypothetical protein
MQRRETTMRFHAFGLVLFLAMSFGAAGCGDAGEAEPGSGGSSGTGGSAAGAGNFGGASFNQCGVAAPFPSDAGCTPVTAPTIVDFDDYAGTGAAADYAFYVNAAPPEPNGVRGGLIHVGDGSDMNGGTSVITTEMVPGEGGSGYALQIANSNATNWGGLLMLYFATPTCLDARGYAGVEFSVKGTSPSGRFGVTLGMLDTTPAADNGLCSNDPSSDCKDATRGLTLPADTGVWTQVRVPFDSLTPGVGSGLACVPVTGQNVIRVVIQPFMSYPPPDFMLVPGPYALAVDNVRFY